MFIIKQAEPLYNLRSKGKMTTTNNPAGNALAITDVQGGLRERDETRNDNYIAQMKKEMESLRDKV